MYINSFTFPFVYLYSIPVFIYASIDLSTFLSTHIPVLGPSLVAKYVLAS